MTGTTRRRTLAALVAVGVAVWPLAASADPGDPDVSFSGDGVVVDDPTASAVGSRVALDAAGRAVVVGSDRTGPGLGDILVARYTTAGERDVTFSGDGFVTLDFAGGYDDARGVTIDGDGRIVVVGEGFNGTDWDIAVARYLPNGTLDPEFSDDGWTLTDLSGSDDHGRGVAIDSAGRIVVAGHTTGASDLDVAVVRYLADGAVDGSFSAAPVDMGGSDSAQAVAVDDRDRVVAVGVANDLPGAASIVLRFEAGGDLDRSFSADGTHTLSIPGDDWFLDVDIDVLGRVIGAGFVTVGADTEAVVHRFEDDGSLDEDFGTGGRVDIEANGYAGGIATSIAATRRGRIMVGGRVFGPGAPDVMAARLTSDGSLETSFADGGIAVADVGAFDFGQGMAIGSFEDVIVAGYTSDAVNELLLVRFLGSFPAKDFADDDASVFEADIESLATAGITRGCNPPANDEFCPDDPVTRGQMAAFLVRALDYADGGGNGFVDDDNSVFEADIARLAAARVTLGCNPPANDRFCPDDPVTRGQMAAFLRRALDGTLAEGPSVEFVDTDQSVFADDVAWLGATGVTRGCNPPANDRFCPDDPVTRGQMAAFLVRALDLD